MLILNDPDLTKLIVIQNLSAFIRVSPPGVLVDHLISALLRVGVAVREIGADDSELST